MLCPGRAQLKPRKATVRKLYEPHQTPSQNTVLDSSALLLYFDGPATATGEDVLELHVHGGPAIVKAVLAAVSRCASPSIGPIRYAEPGEFTRRAFMNNRLDLTQVEALGDTLAADTEQQRRLSVRGTSGTLAKQYESWREQLLYARGELEALIDFSEDQHFDESPSELMSSVSEQVKVLQASLRVHSQNAMRGELLRSGISVSLLGAPNAGKSSLLNRIVGREAAIVSNEAGTTRDIVEISLDLGGYLCRFGDTAGLRKAIEADLGSGKSAAQISQIEQEGMRRAKARADESDTVIVVFSFELDEAGHAVLNLDPEVCEMAQRLSQKKDNVLVALNKADLTGDDVDLRRQAKKQVCEKLPRLDPASIHFISCLESKDQHKAIQAFLDGLISQFGKLTSALTLHDNTGSQRQDLSIWQESLGASERHRVLLEQSITHLDDFVAEAEGSTTSAEDEEADIVLAAEHLRAAADCLAKITGRGEAGDVEEVLGVVFEKFCVGK
ncbi:putative small GTP-binding protein [Septoria linicola]|nr:putative small GTP-binding protein [Septoria linicola]